MEHGPFLFCQLRSSRYSGQYQDVRFSANVFYSMLMKANVLIASALKENKHQFLSLLLLEDLICGI